MDPLRPTWCSRVRRLGASSGGLRVGAGVGVGDDAGHPVRSRAQNLSGAAGARGPIARRTGADGVAGAPAFAHLALGLFGQMLESGDHARSTAAALGAAPRGGAAGGASPGARRASRWLGEQQQLGCGRCGAHCVPPEPVRSGPTTRRVYEHLFVVLHPPRTSFPLSAARWGFRSCRDAPGSPWWHGAPSWPQRPNRRPSKPPRRAGALAGGPSSRQRQRWCAGTSPSTCSMWAPQPRQSGRPHLRQVTREHIPGRVPGGGRRCPPTRRPPGRAPRACARGRRHDRDCGTGGGDGPGDRGHRPPAAPERAAGGDR